VIRGLLREPLVHFLVAGAAIYLALGWFGNPVDPASRTITLTDDDRAGIALGFERTVGRAPTDAEMDGLVDRWVREEVLYREALRLGLDRDDAVVRRRLSTKMDELAAASAETASVDGATLADWLAAHPARFVEDSRLTFDQLYFANESAARAELAERVPRGFPISLPASIMDKTSADVRDLFGQQFAEEISGLPPSGKWQGPVASGFGWHLVRLRARQPGVVPPLASIRDRVEADWRNATIAERREAAYREIRDTYRIKIE
jgi:hypothetical protein